MNKYMNLVIKFITKYFVDSVYCIGYRQTRNFWEETVSKFHVLTPTLRYWYADPIPVERNGKIYVFVEKYDRFRKKGYIGLSILKSNGRLSRPKTVLKADTHLSFPNIIFYKNEYYMVPETSETKKIEIFKMKDSFYHWEHYYTLDVNEKIVDVVPYIRGDDILLIGGVLKDKDPKYVKSQIILLNRLEDVEKLSYDISYTSSEYSLKKRNGGNIYKNGGNKYRILQESTKDIYGKSLILSKILYLSSDGIEEIEVERKEVRDISALLPGFLYKKIGIHTYGCCGRNFEVIDISAAKVSILPFIRFLKNGIK